MNVDKTTNDDYLITTNENNIRCDTWYTNDTHSTVKRKDTYTSDGELFASYYRTAIANGYSVYIIDHSMNEDSYFEYDNNGYLCFGYRTANGKTLIKELGVRLPETTGDFGTDLNCYKINKTEKSLAIYWGDAYYGIYRFNSLSALKAASTPQINGSLPVYGYTSREAYDINNVYSPGID